MPLLAIIISTFSLLWSLYLTYLFLKKSKQDKARPAANLTKTTDLTALQDRLLAVKLVRYNPFQELGGDQSFILSLLDNKKNGVIITSLHTKETTRVFAKTVKNGVGDQVALSKDEKLLVSGNIKN